MRAIRAMCEHDSTLRYNPQFLRVRPLHGVQPDISQIRAAAYTFNSGL